MGCVQEGYVPGSASGVHAAGQTGRVDLGSLGGLGGPALPLPLLVLVVAVTADNQMLAHAAHLLEGKR